MLGEVISESLGYLEEKHEGGYRMRDLLYNQRSAMEREYLEKSIKAEAAWRVAARGPEEEPLDLGVAERVQASLIRSDALTNALTILEDLPEEAFFSSPSPHQPDRWQIAAVVAAAASEHPDAEAEAARQRLSAEAREARVRR